MVKESKVESYEGIVKFFNDSKGYGFIVEKETKKEYFYHHSDSLDRCNKDDVVLFDLEEGNRGTKAVKVRRVKNDKKQEENSK